MFQDREGDEVVHLRRRNSNVNGPTGIYRCVIATTAVSGGETLYVGLYGSGGGICTYCICPIICVCTLAWD